MDLDTFPYQIYSHWTIIDSTNYMHCSAILVLYTVYSLTPNPNLNQFLSNPDL